MIAIPAVDLRGGRCVQLVGGRPEDERVSLPDPVEVARGWWDLGFGSLHVVDLDAADLGVDALGKDLDGVAHVSAVITNLADEAALVSRMRDALTGEVNRRQELLRAAGNLTNIAEYARVRGRDRALAPLPAVGFARYCR